jgi:tetratricopeptide (TPR) repeat protein
MENKDRIGQYLQTQLDDIVFDELSDAYLERAGLADILTGIPVPLRKDELGKITTLTIAKAMAFVIGCDPDFKHKDNYIAYINRMFEERFTDALIAEGVEVSAEKKAYSYACVLFRAAMILDPECANAYYCYGRACKDIYENAADKLDNSEEAEELIARFKAEALEAFEVATLKNPSLADAFYFLGYAYLNMGLYVKAQLTWNEYMKLTEADANIDETDEKMTDPKYSAYIKELRDIRKEIAQRLTTLEEPVKIEQGYNLVISGKYEDGIAALTPYCDSQYKSWWPLWFYLGTAHAELDEDEKAIECYLEVLKYSPSNIEAMEELVKLYKKTRQQDKVEKYEKKIEVVKGNIEKDKELAKKS